MRKTKKARAHPDLSQSGCALSAEDRTLWAEITRSIAPLRKPPAEPVSTPAPPASPHKARAATLGCAEAVTRAAAAKPAPRLEPLDRRQRQRLARGTAPIEARIDLHGKTQSEAHAALVRFLRRAQREGAKFALVITGKGVRGSADGERGVLRRQVPQWLRLPELRAYVVGFEPAHVGHGGEGALYVRIRKSGVSHQRPRDL
ncbi:MAG TPA: Smr/MutS family protein [Xanthobacteraceae bacterium]